MSPSFPLQAKVIKTSEMKQTTQITTASGPAGIHQRRNVDREIKKMLLLNAYPMLYIILWTPGIFNRLLEATGHASRVLTIMQCTTQYVGLANAITYGCSKHLRGSIQTDLTKLFKKWKG
jgi:hypothetical protein